VQRSSALARAEEIAATIRRLHEEKGRVEAKLGDLAVGAGFVGFAATLLTSVKEELGRGYATAVARLHNPTTPLMMEELKEVNGAVRNILQKADLVSGGCERFLLV
jgi:hypothetical protein